jgi:quercetin dioxygenase-like cupin family protein
MAGNRTYLNGAVASFRADVRTDARGDLIPLSFDELPFQPVRAFVVVGREGAMRGEHAHTTGRQLLLCSSGKIKVALKLGNAQEEVILRGPGEGLVIPAPVWSAQTYMTDGATLIVLSDTPFDAASYQLDP